MIKLEDICPLTVLQWIKGDKEGQIEIVDTIETAGDFVWINFVGGGRINGHVVNEMMVHSGIADEKAVEKQNLSKQADDSGLLDAPYQLSTPPPVVQKVEPKNEFGFDILDKAKRDSKMQLDVAIDFYFISEDKLKMLIELYGSELLDSVRDYIRNQITEEHINNCIDKIVEEKFSNVDSSKSDSFPGTLY
tara:strand:+ start:79 stop:651 length:573 start_codon:yes stop_codon:yes gene_type:complete